MPEKKVKSTGTDRITFEEALANLEKSASDLLKPGIRLDEAIKSFEDGIGHYNKCSEILNDAKQKIIKAR